MEEIDDCKTVEFCKEQDRKISTIRMGGMMRTLGKNFSDKEFNEIIDKIENEGDGYVELDKFLTLMADIKTDANELREEQSNLINAFKYFDRERTGFIDYNEFKHILTTVSEKLTNAELFKLDELCKSQVDENGRFRYKDFLELILLR
jgi:calcium-binding protein CML